MKNRTARSLIALVSCVFFLVSQADAGKIPGSKRKHCVSPAVAAQFVSGSPEVRSGSVSANSSLQEGNILVVEADPELLILSNVFDLKDLTVRFHPASRGRYTYTLEPSSFDGQATDTVTLKDDDAVELKFKHFQFPFGRKIYDRCYINSNGNITFDAPDIEPPAPEGIAGNLPRIAAFYSDLDPENAGAVFVHQDADRILISWLKVPEFFNQGQLDYGQNTFQIVLYKSGMIDLVFSDEITATQSFVGLLPGFERMPVRYVDYSTRQSSGRALFSFIENFHDYVSVDLQALMKAIYQTQPDRYDFVSLFSNFELTPVPGTQAFAINVKNNVRGIGNPSDKAKSVFKDNSKYGSKSKLQNITFFGNLHQYPADPSAKLSDDDVSLLDILAHEIGHRWLSYIKLTRDGNSPGPLLGRDRSHWSFFLDTQGSFLEGNQIVVNNANSFQTGTPFQRYSSLDLYLMGLKPASEISDTFYVEGAFDFSPEFPFTAESSPEANVKFKGTQVPVRINDIIAANGSRRPGIGTSQKQFNQLFVLITTGTTPATPEELSYMELVRSLWTDTFHNATEGRATITTVLD